MLTQAQGNGQPSLRPVRSRAMASIALSGRRGESLKEEGRMAMPATWFFTQKGVLFNGKADHSQSLSPSQGKPCPDSSSPWQELVGRSPSAAEDVRHQRESTDHRVRVKGAGKAGVQKQKLPSLSPPLAWLPYFPLLYKVDCCWPRARARAHNSFPRIPFTRGSKLQHAVRLSPVTSPADMDGGCDVVPSMHEEGDDASMHASERGFFSCFHIADDMMGISI
ncbi:hypothetical protein B296_00047884 [Ensete ventricosum]|uniref:Uncharacterized protein n=1 Tax=Ensete ventricosum TaxID=4639 RepID=A0A426X5Q9_ENSVE|nr:hypothetical protein B296_00047884 [Ensete ventricosum]